MSIQSRRSSEQRGNFYLYKHLAVNFDNGTQLIDFPASTRVKVYAEDIDWQFALDAASVITSPNGNGTIAPSNSQWRFWGLPQLGIVMYQDGGLQHAITGTSEQTAIEVAVNGLPIKFAVNDTKGNFGDNSGAFSICIMKVG